MKGLARESLEFLSEPAQGEYSVQSRQTVNSPSSLRMWGLSGSGAAVLFTLTMHPTHSRGPQLLTASTKSLGSSFKKPKLVPAKMPKRLTNIGTSSLVKLWRRRTVLSQITVLKMFRQKWTPSGSGPPLTQVLKSRFYTKNYSLYKTGIWGLNLSPQHSGSPAHTRTTLLISQGKGGREASPC